MNTVNWIMTHATDIALIGTSLIGAFSIIAKLTPTPKDDEIASKLHIGWTKVVDLLALNKQRGQ